MPEQLRRPFATGSKPGPDAVDHYLETQGYYRKHVARDASSLFRVVSDQVFDIQLYHELVRQDCADFMEEHPKEYSNQVDKNYYNYVSSLRKSRTHGSLLELRVLARKYRKNVILFEPTANLQTTSQVYVSDDEYDSKSPIRVFYSHKDKHFDVIYTMEKVERLAESQAIVYSVLYELVYRLPDVKYAVERMLHDQEERTTLPLEDDPKSYKKQSGEIIAFDEPNETSCVLKDPKTCHFHNQENFEEVVIENKDAITVINRADESGRLKIFRPIDGFLHNKEKSCVRQLLDEKITPFPYKVAKALDPSIYRNTEFELWSENRKEQRLKWLDNAEFPMKPCLDDKWFMYDRRNGSYGMRKFYDGKFEHGMVDEDAYMALDDEMKKKYVVLDPSAEPFKLHHLTGLSNFLPCKDSLDLTVMPANINYNRDGNGRGGFKNKRGGNRFGNFHSNNRYENRHFTNSQGPHNTSQMTSVSEIEGREGEKPETTTHYSPNYRHYQQGQEHFEFDGQQQQTQVAQQQQLPSAPMMQQQAWSNGQYPQPVALYQPGQFAIPQHGYQQAFPHPLNYQHVMPYGNFAIPPPISYSSSGEPQTTSDAPAGEGGDVMNIMRESELSANNINFKAKECSDFNDLPMNDIPTMQFYYNLGVRYFHASGVHRRLESVVSQLENLEVNEAPGHVEKVADQVQSLVEPPPVPTNTPVSTKPVHIGYGQGNRYQQQHGNNFRRPFNNNRENNGGGTGYRGNWNSHNPRKEIKFNSNVKNLHKVEPKRDANTSNTSTSTQQSASSKSQNSQEKTSPQSVSQFSPISPVSQDQPAAHYQQPQMQDFQTQGQQHQPPFYSQQAQMWPRPMQQVVCQMNEDGTVQPLPQQPGVGIICQVNEDGSVTNHYAPQTPYPYPHFQQAQQFVPQYVQQPVFYPVQQPVMDGTISSNDSGMAEPQVFYQQGFQQSAPVQFYAPPYQQQAAAVPIYYAQSPLPQTPQIAQVGPVFPVPQTPVIKVPECVPITQTSSIKSQPSDGSGDGKKADAATSAP